MPVFQSNIGLAGSVLHFEGWEGCSSKIALRIIIFDNMLFVIDFVSIVVAAQTKREQT